MPTRRARISVIGVRIAYATCAREGAARLTRQVYRQANFGTGKAVGDSAEALNEALPRGRGPVAPGSHAARRHEPVPLVWAHEVGAGHG